MLLFTEMKVKFIVASEKLVALELQAHTVEELGVMATSNMHMGHSRPAN